MERARKSAIATRASAIIAAASLAMPADASPWGREPGTLFLSTRADYFLARADADDPLALGPQRFERIESNAYAEIGVAHRAMIGVKVVYGTSSYFDGFETFSASGFSEIEGFAQRELLRDHRQVLALRFAGAAPSRVGAGLRPGLGNDGADAEARLSYGRTLTLRPVKIFAVAEAGYRRRFGSSADQFRGDFAVGAEPSRRLLAMVEIFSTASLGAAAPGGADYDVVKIQPSLAWRATRRCSLHAGVTHEAWGRNLLLGDTWFLGLWTEF